MISTRGEQKTVSRARVGLHPDNLGTLVFGNVERAALRPVCGKSRASFLLCE